MLTATLTLIPTPKLSYHITRGGSNEDSPTIAPEALYIGEYVSFIQLCRISFQNKSLKWLGHYQLFECTDIPIGNLHFLLSTTSKQDSYV